MDERKRFMAPFMREKISSTFPIIQLYAASIAAVIAGSAAILTYAWDEPPRYRFEDYDD